MTDPIQHLIDAAKAVTAVGRRDYGDLTDEMKDAVMALSRAITFYEANQPKCLPTDTAMQRFMKFQP